MRIFRLISNELLYAGLSPEEYRQVREPVGENIAAEPLFQRFVSGKIRKSGFHAIGSFCAFFSL